MYEINAHVTVSKLAEEMAQEIYEELAKRNSFYAGCPHREAFVKRVAPTLREEARRTLGEMLARNDVSDAEKTTIHEALVLDHAIRDLNQTHYH